VNACSKFQEDTRREGSVARPSFLGQEVISHLSLSVSGEHMCSIGNTERKEGRV